jgi:branched-chain amino acid transport system substrate-binding protein
MVNFLKQSDELNYSPVIMSFRTMDDPTLIKNAGDLSEGLLFTSTFDNTSQEKESIDFVELYKNKYGIIPDTYSAEGYLGAKLVIDSFAQCGDNKECVYKYLSGLKNIDSIFGNISFDSNGNVDYNYFVTIIKNGKAQILR